MLKKLFMNALVVTGLLATTLNAGDYSSSANCCPEGTEFDGFYVGANLGGISHTAHRNDLDGFLTDNSGWSTIDTGFTGGIQAGYNFRSGSAVYGLVADWNGASLGRTIHNDPNGSNDSHHKHDLRWYSTIRAKTGMALCNTQLYLTGGFAVAKVNNTWHDDGDHYTHNNTRWGWVAGAGAEYDYCNNFSFGVELLYLSFSNKNGTFNSGSGSESVAYRFGHSDSAITGRVFLNYYFDDLFSCCR